MSIWHWLLSQSVFVWVPDIMLIVFIPFTLIFTSIKKCLNMSGLWLLIAKKHKKLKMELEHWWTIGGIHGLMSRGLITHGVRGRSPSRTSVTAGAAKVDNFYSALLKQPCSVGSILVEGFHSTAITEKKQDKLFSWDWLCGNKVRSCFITYHNKNAVL